MNKEIEKEIIELKKRRDKSTSTFEIMKLARRIKKLKLKL